MISLEEYSGVEVPIFKDWIHFVLGLDTSSSSTGLALMVDVSVLLKWQQQHISSTSLPTQYEKKHLF